ncbi:MAG: polysaccharide deacetylase family protein [Undibacterium umbellatum]|uniref:polysaccharide deacetylase family protein n=1 Tax=Undibacterium umbellatum TaxID=2762300 RepID=UPI003BB79F23
MQTEDPGGFENRPAYRRIGIYLLALIVLGMAVSVFAYLSSMQVLGWQMPEFNLQTPFKSAGGVNSTPASKGLYLYASPNTRSYFASIGGNYDRLLTPWRAYAKQRQLSFKEISDPQELSNIKDGVLVLASAVALSEQERTSLQEYRARGGAILATWATGTRNEKGEWAGWQFLEAMGATSKGEIALESKARFLILNGETPLTHSQPAGQRIWLGNASESLLRFSGEGAASIMDWARVQEPERKNESAVLYAEPSADSGRSAVFAFAESAWESQPYPIYSLVDDTLIWLQRRPALLRAAWPEGKYAAQIIEMDTEEGFANALRFASLIRSINYRGSFYVLTSVAKQFPAEMKQLAREYDIGFHGDTHISFKEQGLNEQEKRINIMREDLKSILPDLPAITGFRAPLEGYDQTTQSLLQKNGFLHHVTDPNSSEGRLPVFVKIDGISQDKAMILLPRTQRDDLNLNKEQLDLEQTRQALISDAETSKQMGALGLLSVHSQSFEENSLLTQAFPAYLAYLKANRNTVWLASSSQVADWWHERDRLKLSSSIAGKRIEFDMTVTGNKPLANASLILMLPQKSQLPNVLGLKIGMPKATVRRIDDFRAAIVFETLEPGNYAYQAVFN